MDTERAKEQAKQLDQWYRQAAGLGLLPPAVDAIVTLFDDAAGKLNALNESITRLGAQEKTLEARVRGLDAELASALRAQNDDLTRAAEQKRATLEDMVKPAELKVNELNEAATTLMLELDTLRTERDEVKADIAKLKAQLEETQRSFDAWKAERGLA